MDSMNLLFGSKLRRELVKLMSDYESRPKNRTYSLNSQTHSVDSLGGADRRNEKGVSEEQYDQLIWAEQ